MLLISALWKQSEKDHKFKAVWEHMRPCLQRKKQYGEMVLKKEGR